MNSTTGRSAAAAKNSSVYWKKSASWLGALAAKVWPEKAFFSSPAVATDAAITSPATGIADSQYGAISFASSRKDLRPPPSSRVISARKVSTKG